MTNEEMRETIRQMLKDWKAATPEQRQSAQDAADRAVAQAVTRA